MKSCNTNNYTMETSPIYHTTSGISWNGANIHCQNEDGTISLDICQGDRLTTAQTEIATAICNLISATDGASVVMPTCLIEAFGTQDATILNIITFGLNQLCVTNAQVDGLQENKADKDQLVTLEWQCCEDNPCVKTGEIKLTEALQNIINCLCTLRTEFDALKVYVGNSEDLSNLSSEIIALKAQFTALNSTVNGILLKTVCLPDC